MHVFFDDLSKLIEKAASIQENNRIFLIFPDKGYTFRWI